MRWKRVYAVAFALHFLLISTVSCRELTFNVARGLTIAPGPARSVAQRFEPVVEAALGRHLGPQNPVRTALSTYWHLGGIEGGYGFFAPNVPSSYKLVLELHDASGRIEYDLPRVGSHAAGLRIASLLDQVGRTQSEPMREYIVRSMAASAWRDHPQAVLVRAVFGKVVPPTIDEAGQGKKETYQVLFVYDFSRADTEPPPHE